VPSKPVMGNKKIIIYILYILISILIIVFNLVFANIPNGYILLLVLSFMAIALIRVRDKLSFLYGLALLIVLSVVGIIQFEYFPQARVLYEAGLTPWELLVSFHPHSVRYLVSYPAVLITHFFNTDINSSYTYYCIILLSIMMMNVQDVVNLIKKDKGISNALVLRGMVGILPIILLSSLMNGRLVPAFAGMSMILKEMTGLFFLKKKLDTRLLIIVFFGFFITTVSSGTMMVAAGEIVACLVIYMIKFRRQGTLLFFSIIFSPILYVAGKYIIFMTNRNILYFGGGLEGFIKMLNHGFGRLFHYTPLIILTFCVLMIFFLSIMSKVYFYFLRNKLEYIPLVISFPIAFIGGLFGISTALMIVPSLIVIGLLVVGI